MEHPQRKTRWPAVATSFDKAEQVSSAMSKKRPWGPDEPSRLHKDGPPHFRGQKRLDPQEPFTPILGHPYEKYDGLIRMRLEPKVVIARRKSDRDSTVDIRRTQVSESKLYLLKSMKHESLLPVLEIYLSGSDLFLVHPHVLLSLERVIAAPVDATVPQIAQLARQIVSGLTYLHGQGWVHGRLHPSTLVFTRDGHVRLSGSFALWTRLRSDF